MEIDNFLSFDHFEWQDISETTNFVTGPNGVGKTNLFRALRVLASALSFDAKPDWATTLTHLGTTDPLIRIAANVSITGQHDQQLMVGFLSAAIIGGFMPTGVTYAGKTYLSTYLRDNLRPDHVEPFLSGPLVVEYRINRGWRSWYEGTAGTSKFRWWLEGDQPSSLEVSQGQPA
jgi:AAA domain, putative AbiEii toxin, Type IV TA system